MKGSGWNHFNDAANFVDILICIFHSLFLVLYYTESNYKHEILIVTACAGLYRGFEIFFRQFKTTRFLVVMVQNTMKEMIPFLLFFIGQLLCIAAIFSITEMNGEDFFSTDGNYSKHGHFFRSFLLTLDFTQGKDDYRFSSTTGCIIYVVGLLYLNIIILNLVIAITGDVYDSTMANKAKSELSLKSKMLLDLFYFLNAFKCFFPECEDMGNLMVLRLDG